jgi:hypothetical protein
MKLFNQPEQTVLALIDGGSSHSFISPAILTPKQLKLSADKSCSVAERQNFVIKSATGTLKSACCVSMVPIRIASWTLNTHGFSGAITKHYMVIGTDFFVKHKVKTDHEDDSMLGIYINLNVNQTSENANTVILKDKISETGWKSIEVRLELIYQELNGLKLHHAEVKAAQAKSGSSPSFKVSDSLNVEKEKDISQPGF